MIVKKAFFYTVTLLMAGDESRFVDQYASYVFTTRQEAEENLLFYIHEWYPNYIPSQKEYQHDSGLIYTQRCWSSDGENSIFIHL